MSDDLQFDALVIGAGAGGVSAAARLARAGYRTLLAESLERVGGRASTREVDGFLLNTGALAIESDGPIVELYRDLGLELDLWIPKPQTALLWGKHVINVDPGGGLAGVVRTVVPKLLGTLGKVAPFFRPKDGQSTTDWLNRFTRSKRVHNLVDNVCGAFFAAAGDDLPAAVLLQSLTQGSSFKHIGYTVGGTIEVWKGLAGYVQGNGGAVWLNAPVKRLLFSSNGLVSGAEIEHDGQLVTVSADVTVSNVGPLNTVRLGGADNFPGGYAGSVEKATDGAAIITVHFASQKPLVQWPGLALAGKSRRLTYAGNFSAPEQKRILRPGTWYLYSAASTPRPARGTFDLEKEKELLLADIGDYFSGFARSMILDIDVTAHEWPAQRAITGYDLPIETPIANLWNVGDGVKQWGDAGTAACTRTANRAVEQIIANFPPRGGPAKAASA
ncbi:MULTISPECIES: phytoene desaturase family protein [Sphingobium]|nr:MULTISPECIES: FAD-dependent oxidoreductase [Sphingobium]QNG43956.1 FAD-dependent oxidoreductase [Sphingobium yanoikuyae]